MQWVHRWVHRWEHEWVHRWALQKAHRWVLRSGRPTVWAPALIARWLPAPAPGSHLRHVLVPPPAQIDNDVLPLRHTLRELHRVVNGVGSLEGGYYPLVLAEQIETLERLGVCYRGVASATGALKVRVLGSDTDVVQTGGYALALLALAGL